MLKCKKLVKSLAKGCLVKRKFLSEKHANIYISTLKSYRRAYRCNHCSKYHITSNLPIPQRYVVYFDFNERFDNLLVELNQFIDTLE